MSLDKKIRELNHKRIDKMRAIKLSLSRFFFSPFSKYSNEVNGDSILVLRLDGKLGDGITATGFLHSLKKNTQKKIIIFSSSVTADLYRNLDFVDDVCTVDKSFFSTLKAYWKNRNKNYTYIINTSHILNPRVVFLVCFLRAYKKISMGRVDGFGFSDSVSIDFRKEHITDRYRNVLKLISSEKNDLKYRVNIESRSLVKAKNYVDKLRQKYKTIILINSFAGGRLRNLNSQSTKSIVNELLKKTDCVVISVANQGDHNILNEWIDATYEGRWVHNNEIASLADNLALLSLADIIITPDTAWVHMASALGKKLIAIYRKDHAEAEEQNAVIWAPYGSEHRIYFADSLIDDDINHIDAKKVAALVESIDLTS